MILTCFTYSQLMGTGTLSGPLLGLAMFLFIVDTVSLHDCLKLRQRDLEAQKYQDECRARRQRRYVGLIAHRRVLIQTAWNYRKWSRDPKAGWHLQTGYRDCFEATRFKIREVTAQCQLLTR